MLWHCSIYWEWQQCFTHDDEYFEFILGDLGYMGQEMFIMWRIGRRKIAPNANMDWVHVYDMDGMHACRLQGVGGMGYQKIEKKMEKVHGEGSWRGLIAQNQDIHISSNLEPYSLTFCIKGGWTSLTRLSVTIFLIFKTIDGLGTFNYMHKQALTCALKLLLAPMLLSSLKSSPSFCTHGLCPPP